MGGFAFILIFGFILLPLTIVLAILRATSQKEVYGKAIGFIWLCVLGLIVFLTIFSELTNKKDLIQNDIYGEYIIDRSKYSGKQSDWQYNNFRFEITRQNDFLFYKTDKEKILKTYKGKVEFIDGFHSPRLLLKFDTSKLNILEQKPTLYRQVWTFYYVFNSSKFGNMFFTKGTWKPIKN
jgi:hypothetical protein